MGFALLFLLSFFGSFSSNAQTVLINPTAEGGFELGSTFAANGWNVSNFTPVPTELPNPWIIKPITNGAITGNAAIISSNGATPIYSISSSCTNYFYRDITVPAGQSKIKLDFNWLCGGESTWDMWQVFVAPTTITPIAALHAGTGAANVPAGINGATFVGNGNLQATTVQTATLYLPPSLAGTTFRLIFVWKSDTSGGVQPSAQIDNISLVSSVPGNYISIATGDWSAPSTWDLGTSPSPLDNATVSTGHTVTVNAINQSVNNLTVNGTLAYATTPTSFGVLGNLTVANSGLVNVFQGTIGKTLMVSGNIVNNGTMDISVGATTAGSLTLNGSAVQTVSGSGIFMNDVIRNLNFANTNTATPNVIWNLNNIKVAYDLNLTGSRISLGSNKLTFGNNAGAGTLTSPVGTGFLPGGKFSRWHTSTVTGTAITAGADPTGNVTRYPFITASGVNRSMFITRTNNTGAVAGELAVVYNDATTTTSNLNIADGAYTVTDRYNGNWVVSDEFSAIAASSYKIALFAQNGLVPLNGNSRVVGASSAFGGVHQNGTVTPSVQRINVAQADLLAGPIYVGINIDDVPYLSVASGNWNSDSIWNKGVSPSCGDIVAIGSGTTVTSNSAGNFAKNVTIVPGATLVIASGDLTTGCDFKNHQFVNNGTLTVSGGTLTVNGNIVNNAGSTFNQSGGNIVIDGNDGVIANSVLTGVALLRVTANIPSNLNLTGGNITIVNPHRGTSTVDASLSISQGGSPNAASPNHTVVFGDGGSNIPAGSTGGFYMNLYVGSQYYSLGSVIVDGTTATNRHLKSSGNTGILGNLTINSGEYQMSTSTFVAGNIVNNGTLSATSLLAMGTFVPPSSIAPSTVPQSISGTGIFRNSLTIPTANFTNFQVSNSNASGLTLNVPISVSGTLTTTSGLINTTSTNVLTLGTAAIAGTLGGTPNATTYVKGPFVRTISTGNLGTNYILFPVGKSNYSPVSVAPTTTEVSTMRAEAFDSNTGTAGAGVTNLSANRRWTTALELGAFTNIKVRLGDALITNGKIPVQASTEAGTYLGAFGSVASFTAGTPNVIESDATVSAANFTGFLSFAESNACSGTPTPGNTVASSTTFCSGQLVNLTLQNLTAGAGVTYQWKSSADGITYANITGATAAAFSLTPSAGAFYKCDVTCTASASTVSSTPVQVTFTNNIVSNTPAIRCGVGTLSLAATGNAGTTLNWYSVPTGGTILASGSPFVTPSLTATTDYYVEASTSAGYDTLGPVSPTAQGGTIGVQATAWDISFTVTQATQLSSVDVFPVTAGQTSAIALRTSTGAVITTVNFTTAVGGGATAQTIPLNFTLAPGSYQLYPTLPAAGVSRNTTGAVYPYTSGVASITGNGFDMNYFMGMYNWQFGSKCVSPRVKVTATITTAPVLTLSSVSSNICSGSTTPSATITSNAADFDSYSWSPTTGVSGSAATGFSFNPTVSTNYTLTALNSTSSCTAIANFAVTVNAIPAFIVTPATSTICADAAPVLLTAAPTSSGTVAIGTGTSVNAQYAYPSPFSNWYGGAKHQMLYRASELTALGFVQGDVISGLAINVTSVASGFSGTLNGFSVLMGNTTSTVLTSTSFIDNLTVVRPNSVLTVGTTGFPANVNIPLTNTFTWDGTSNLVIQTSYSNNDGGTGDVYTAYSLPGFDSTNWYRSDNQTPAVVRNSTLPTGVSANRPNIVLTKSNVFNYTWSPVDGLFTTAAMTTPYTGAVSATVYARPTATTTYVATATNANTGCTSAVNAVLTVINTPAPTATPQTLCNNATVTNLVATGTGIKWYSALIGGIALANTTALVTGTYYASQTISGCESTRTMVSITVSTDVTAAPTGAATQDFTTGQTLANFTVVTAPGATIIWYSAATGGTVLPSTTVLVSGITYYASQTISGCESPVRLAVTAGADLKIPGFEINNLSYYPNPVKDVLTVNYSEAIQAVHMYNMLGQLVYNRNTNTSKVTIDMTSMATGSYILKITVKGKTSNVKVIKR